MRGSGGRILVAALAALAVVAVAASPGSAAVPDDPMFPNQWGLRAIRAPEAWEISKGEGITIAIVDTGINRDHEDLAPQIHPDEYDAINQDFDALDLQGHGTGVAAVAAAATNNGVGVAGVAPDAKVMAVRAFGAAAGAGADPAEVADGIMWAVDNGAQVVNLSLGAAMPIDPFLTDLLEVSIVYAAANGVLVIAAAGNSTAPFCSSPAFNPFAVCVGASDQLNRLAPFSHYGLGLDLVAPGSAVWTAGYPLNHMYGPTQGTSFAAPVVSGVGALLMSMGADNLTAVQILKSTARDLGLPGPNLAFGWGLVDAKAAVDRCEEVC